ncbi:MAG: hypothetical protein WBN99_11675, partial [Mycobacterium sp.]
HHTRPIGPALDTLDPYPWQPKQQCRTVRHWPLVPFVSLNASQLSDFGRPGASNFNDTLYESEITTAHLRLKSR